jgi:hypothetical protein
MEGDPMNEPEAFGKLKTSVEFLLHRELEGQLTSDALVAMIAALIETHPDKVALHESFSHIFQAMGGAQRAVQGMGQGKSGSLTIMAVFSKAIGRELP